MTKLHWTEDDNNDHSLCGGCESPDCSWNDGVNPLLVVGLLLLIVAALLRWL